MHPLLRQLGAIALLLGASQPAWAEFILFPELNGFAQRDIEPDEMAMPSEHSEHPLRKNQLDAALDIFYSADYGRLRLLSELEVEITEREIEIERLQAGWLFGSGTTAWIGRFHTPLGYWNTQYHHGSYLQTAVTRPGIMEFHGLKAPLPLHIAGLLVEGTHPLENQEIHYQISLGAGPNLQHHGLEPVDFLNLNTGAHKFSAAARLSYLPDPVIPNEIGGFAAYTVIPSIHKTIREIRQTIAGAFGNWEYQPLRLIGEMYFISNDLIADAATARASFVSYNLQAEYTLHPNWTVYARAEDTLNANNDPYLDIFPEFIRRRALAGLRFDLTHNQALKLEWAEIRRQDGRFNEIILQWSAAFP
ncbi:MAG: hypothetical protein ABIN45_04740 [Gammaproteobacteria bacterium]